MKHIPWVEKYRPKIFNDIVLDKNNRIILKNIVEKGHFPNLLFYGPPGTGKTTSIIRLIEEYQKKYFKINKEHIIHLNASDERGIDVIRNQIKTFVNSKNLFVKGLKFVILDEVDYMTKSAQQALKFLLQENNENIRFCLICNYISKIEISLQNEFVKLRFNELPKNEIVNLLKFIVKEENLSLKVDKLKIIQKMFDSDLRSMINFLQLNCDNNDSFNNFISNKVYDKLVNKCKQGTIRSIEGYIKKIAESSNFCDIQVMKEFLTYLVIERVSEVNIENLLEIITFYIQSLNSEKKYLINYTILALKNKVFL